MDFKNGNGNIKSSCPDPLFFNFFLGILNGLFHQNLTQCKFLKLWNSQKAQVSFQYALFCTEFELIFNPTGKNVTTLLSLLYTKFYIVYSLCYV